MYFQMLQNTVLRIASFCQFRFRIHINVCPRESRFLTCGCVVRCKYVRACMRVRTRSCVCVGVHVCVFVRMRVCVHLCVCTCVCVRTRAQLCKCVYVFLCARTYLRAHMYACVCDSFTPLVGRHAQLKITHSCRTNRR